MDSDSDKKSRESARAYFNHARDRLASQAVQRKALSDQALKTIGFSAAMGGSGLTLIRFGEAGPAEILLFVGLGIAVAYSVHQAFQIVLPGTWNLSADLDDLADHLGEDSVDIILSLADTHRCAEKKNAEELAKLTKTFVRVVRGLYVEAGFLAALILVHFAPKLF